ncbi:MAG: amidohydrolase [Candidatus Hodarchaeota archaeon]
MPKESDNDINWDLLCFNGLIHTLDDNLPKATWMLIHEGRIARLGEDPTPDISVRQSLDLQGKTVVPGFIDSHTHLASHGIAQTFWVNLGEAKSQGEIEKRLRKKALELQEDEWLVAYNWDESQWEAPILLNREILDRACPSHPVFAIREDGHFVAVNSKALELLAEPLSKLKGEERAEASQGRLRDIDIDRKLFYPDPSKILKGIEAGCDLAAQLGITSANDMISAELLRYYFKAEKKGLLKIRIHLNVPPTVLSAVETIGIASGFGSDKLRIGGLKLFYDGSIGAQTALVSEDFTDMPGEKGIIYTPSEEFTKYLDKAIKRRIQPVVHAIGDQAIENVLNEYAARRESIAALRPRIEHVEMVTDSQMAKAAELNVIFSMQPNFCKWAFPGGLYETRLGKKRTRQMNAFSKVVENKVRLAFGSDGMPLGPLLGLHYAVNHPVKESSLSVDDAIRSYTIEGAYCEFQEHEKGTLSEGKLADFVVLSGNPWETPDKIKEMKVEMTAVGGEIAYKEVNTALNLK